MSERCLVIVRAGDASLHEAWLGPVGQPRDWDLVVNYFGDDPERYRRPDVLRIDGKGPKWIGLQNALTQGGLDWRAYDRIWLPDDDLAATPDAVSRLFAACREHELALAQPSLSHDSYISHAITVHNPRYTLRWTNFIELMAPVLSRDLLARVLPTFDANQSGWWLDYLWQMYLDRPRLDAGIVDAVQVRHTRPVGGPNYARMKATGQSPWVEMNTLRRRYALTDIDHVCWQAQDTAGQCWRLDDPAQAMTLLGGVLDGMRPWLQPSGIDESITGHLRHSPALQQAAQRSRGEAVAA